MQPALLRKEAETCARFLQTEVTEIRAEIRADSPICALPARAFPSAAPVRRLCRGAAPCCSTRRSHPPVATLRGETGELNLSDSHLQGSKDVFFSEAAK